MLESEVGGSFSLRFQNSARVYIGFDFQNEYIDEDWEVREGFLIPEGTYHGKSAFIWAVSDESKPLTLQGNISYGNYYTGNRLRARLESSITRISRLKLDLEYNANWVRLPEGKFQANTFALRSYYYFSTELYLKGYLQLNADRLANDGRQKTVANILLRWIYSPGSDLYIVYNDGRLIGAGRDEIQNRTIMLKATFFWRK
jgi:hypothetical protein